MGTSAPCPVCGRDHAKHQLLIASSRNRDYRLGATTRGESACRLWGHQPFRQRRMGASKRNPDVLAFRPGRRLYVDGTLNEAGAIREVVMVILQYGEHKERATFSVTKLGGQDMLLGLTWLRQHNLEIDWRSEEVKMMRCPLQCNSC
jgi:hypothetical protein